MFWPPRIHTHAYLHTVHLRMKERRGPSIPFKPGLWNAKVCFVGLASSLFFLLWRMRNDAQIGRSSGCCYLDLSFAGPPNGLGPVFPKPNADVRRDAL